MNALRRTTTKPVCSCDGCDKPSKCAGMCSMHYSRQYRNGTLEKVRTRKASAIHSGGYIVEHNANHPLTTGSAEVYQHRRIYYDAHGAGPFNCKDCDVQVTWENLHIDHLDDCRSNNELSNLAAKCPRCNVKRGFEKSRETKRARNGLVYQGRKYLVGELAAMIGMTHVGLAHRLKTMSLDEAMAKPPHRILKRNHDKCSKARQAEMAELRAREKNHE